MNLRLFVQRVLAALGVLAVLTGAASAAEAVGFRELKIPADPAIGRPLEGAIWYPAADAGPDARIGDTAVFFGEAAKPGAPALTGRHPLVVISHGSEGNWTNQAWLARALAMRGYVVAAVNHPGTTTRDRDPVQAMRLWERPRDLSRLIDYLAESPEWASFIRTERVAVIGHSLGAWTAVASAGGRTDPLRLARDCETNKTLKACEVFAALGAGTTETSRANLARPMRDDRIAAAVSLDIGLARAFTPESLQGLRTPLLIVQAGDPSPGIPASMESGYLVQALQPANRHVVEVAGATHFSFMSLCKPAAVAILEEEAPGDGMVCKERPGVDRRTLHAQIIEEIVRFLAGMAAPQ